MKVSSRWLALGMMVWMVGAFSIAPPTLAKDPKVRKTWRYSDIDIPVSLAEGTVRTPAFAVKPEAYFIYLQAEKHLPFTDLVCMMAMAIGPCDGSKCPEEPILQADWVVLDGDRIVARGRSPNAARGFFTDEHIFKNLGWFMGEANKTYTVDVTFTKDGTPLNVCNPHLIVITVRNH